MVDIQCAAAEIRRVKKKKINRKKETTGENIMAIKTQTDMAQKKQYGRIIRVVNLKEEESLWRDEFVKRQGLSRE